MAAVSTSRRSLAGVFFIVGGALLLLQLILSLAKVASLSWLAALGLLAIAIAFAILAIGAVNSTLAKIALWAAAVGWALLAISALGLIAFPAVLLTIAALVAGVGGLIAAIVLYVGKEIRNTPAILFIVTTVLGLLYLLPSIGVAGLGQLGTVIAVLFGIGLVVTGYLFTRKEGRR